MYCASSLGTFILWNAAYLGIAPFRMLTALSKSGSVISTLAKRRSKALSRSIVFANSAWVVAPISLISPLASCGFRILPASIAPSAAPVPTIPCSSSIKRITFLSFAASSVQAFKRSSKSPLYLAPAKSKVRSSENILALFRLSGTFPS